ncbi:MAG: precorrin-6y C5,15-methyltransferase (decarboxylating) subunit CbiE [Dethiobacter sp.]|jgi:cobalt-precorrin-7 (C5)-methyltransferase|nr:precorrin-6y C5,15-methyltransferase (decarboxylating) subunit CbiE [Dethiobacter sp.]
MAKIVVAGAGPGGEEFILPVVWRKAAEADVLVGGERALAPFRGLGKETLAVTADLSLLVSQLHRLAKERKVVVLVSGDPGFYSLLSFLRRHFSAEELEVIPGISSLQAAFARLAEPWHAVALLSAHGRDANEILPALLAGGKKAVLTDRCWTPHRLASLMLGAGSKDRRVSLCYRLTGPDEQITHTTLATLNNTVEGDCIMVIHDE